MPSGLNATAWTGLGWIKGWPSGRPVAASHSRAVAIEARGQDGLAVGAERHGPDGAGWAIGVPSNRPVAASQSRAVPSS